MTLFLDVGGLSDSAFGNLFSISRQDGNLGDTAVATDPTLLLMTYVGAAPAPATAARLFTLINTNFGTPIVITALNAGIDPFSGIDITGNGVTYVDSSSGSNVIRCVYDVSQCNGAGIFAFDTGGNQITFPTVPLIYHELSHAFRRANGTSLPNDEPPAETDENVMRAELGLCLRDVNNHGGGCGGGNDCGGTSNGGCFIVSATTGSPESVEVMRLRRLRDRVAGASGTAAELVRLVYNDYYQFSPRIAATLQRDSVARAAVLAAVVRPLLAWYTFAGKLAFETLDPDAVRLAARDVLNAVPPVVDADTQTLLELAPRLTEAAQFRFAAWALVDPLRRVWACANSESELIGEVSAWLAAAPLDAVDAPGDPEALEIELNTLGGLLNFDPVVREEIGRRLAAVWPTATSALARHGFTSQRGASWPNDNSG